MNNDLIMRLSKNWAQLSQLITQTHSDVHILNAEFAEMNILIGQLKLEHQKQQGYQMELSEIYASKTWRAAMSFRAISVFLISVIRGIKKVEKSMRKKHFYRVMSLKNNPKQIELMNELIQRKYRE